MYFFIHVACLVRYRVLDMRYMDVDGTNCGVAGQCPRVFEGSDLVTAHVDAFTLYFLRL